MVGTFALLALSSLESDQEFVALRWAFDFWVGIPWGRYFMERCAATPASQASEFTENLSESVGTNRVPSAVASRLDDDPDDARWAEVSRVRDERKEWSKRLGLHDDEVQLFIDNGLGLEVLLTKQLHERKAMADYLRKRSGPIPRWVMISGLFKEADKDKGGVQISEESRRKRLRALYKAAVLLIKRALGRHEIDVDKAERSVFWDPVAMVARDLDIPPSKLSQLLKEFSGHSLSQVIDNCRVAALKGKLRAGVRGFLKGRVAGNNAQGDCVGMEKAVWAVWGELRKSRKWPEFSPNTWANELGFASYRRLYRACVSVYGRTPYQMEIALIREELEGTAKTDEGVDWVEGLKGVEEAVKAVRAYCEEGYTENG
ncbi:MAG: hypothetical protein WCT04_12135 [Planctomycetota bacterium]